MSAGRARLCTALTAAPAWNHPRVGGCREAPPTANAGSREAPPTANAGSREAPPPAPRFTDGDGAR